MSEKYYVVSKEELNRLVALCIDHGMTDSYDLVEYHKTADEYLAAEAACRARPVPEWATHFTTATDGSTELADEERGFRFKEIKR